MHIFIVGFGSIGQRHLRVFRSLLPEAKISIVRQHYKVGRETRLPIGANNITNDFDSILKAEPDAVILSGPASTRLASLRPLVKAGLNIFIEKPIAIRTEGLAELLDTASANKCIIYVGYVLRHLPVLISLKEMLDEGFLGPLFSFQAYVGQHLADWRPDSNYRESVSAQAELGGGAIFELSHELHYVRWLLGMPDTVYCLSTQVGNLGIDVEDTANMIFKYASGLSACVHLDFLQRPASRFCTISGENGRLEADLIAGTLTFQNAKDKSSSIVDIELLTDRDSLYKRQAEHFLASIKGLENPLVSGQDGLAVLNMILAAKSSATTKAPSQIRESAHE